MFLLARPYRSGIIYEIVGRERVEALSEQFRRFLMDKTRVLELLIMIHFLKGLL